MLVKILGGILLTVGVLFAAKMLFGFLVAILSIAAVGGLIWGGWRLLSRS
jgi:hypothetical protein